MLEKLHLVWEHLKVPERPGLVVREYFVTVLEKNFQVSTLYLSRYFSDSCLLLLPTF